MSPIPSVDVCEGLLRVESESKPSPEVGGGSLVAGEGTGGGEGEEEELSLGTLWPPAGGKLEEGLSLFLVVLPTVLGVEERPEEATEVVCEPLLSGVEVGWRGACDTGEVVVCGVSVDAVDV